MNPGTSALRGMSERDAGLVEDAIAAVLAG